ncbi:MAG: hypothetical protein AAFV43_02750 [Planctomycetota bacterium]
MALATSHDSAEAVPFPPLFINGPAGTTSFGNQLDLSGRHLLTSDTQAVVNGETVGRAYLLDVTDGSLLYAFDDPTPRSAAAGVSGSYGQSLAIDGNYVLIGDPRDDTFAAGSGQAHLFDANTGQYVRTFSHPLLANGANFGWAVELDGTRAVIGAPGDRGRGINDRGEGSAFVYDLASGDLISTLYDPTPTERLVDGAFSTAFGSSVSISNDTVVVSDSLDDTAANNSGQIHVFGATSGALERTIESPQPTPESRFGSPWATVSDGNILTYLQPGGRAYWYGATNGELVAQVQPGPAGYARLIAASGGELRTFPASAVSGNYAVGGDPFSNRVIVRDARSLPDSARHAIALSRSLSISDRGRNVVEVSNSDAVDGYLVASADAPTLAFSTTNGQAQAAASVDRDGTLTAGAFASAGGPSSSAAGRGVAIMPFTNVGSDSTSFRVNAVLRGSFQESRFDLPTGALGARAAAYIVGGEALRPVLEANINDPDGWLLDGGSEDLLDASELVNRDVRPLLGVGAILAEAEVEPPVTFDVDLEVSLETGFVTLDPDETVYVVFDVSAFSFSETFVDQTGAGSALFLNTLSAAENLFTDPSGNPVYLEPGDLNAIAIPEPSATCVVAVAAACLVRARNRHAS